MVKIKEYVVPISGATIRIGRDADGNDKLVNDADPEDTLVHTAAPGSPFVNAGICPSNEVLTLSGAICVKYSQDWRDNHSDTYVNVFKRKDMKKTEKMKPGTWEVKKQDGRKIKKAEVIRAEKELGSEEP